MNRSLSDFLVSYTTIVLVFSAWGIFFSRPTDGSHQPKVLGLATGDWPQECPKCGLVDGRFYHNFFPVPYITRLENASGTAQTVLGTANSVTLFTPQGGSPQVGDDTWPSAAMDGLLPGYVYHFPADRDGDGRNELLSVYIWRELTFRWFSLEDTAPLLERTYPAAGLLYSISTADLDGDGRSETILVLDVSTADTGISKISVYSPNFDLLWERSFSDCGIDYYKYYDNLAVGDVNGDNQKEIFFSCEYSKFDPESWWVNTGKIYAFTYEGRPLVTNFSDEPYLFAKRDGGGQSDLVLGDLNGDGQKEILANPMLESGSILVFDHQGNTLAEKNYSDAFKDHNAYGLPPGSITLADLDDNGTLEIITSDFYVRTEDTQDLHYGRIYMFTPETDGDNNIVGLKSLNPERENGLAWQSPSPLHTSSSESITAYNTLKPNAVLVGDVSGDGINDLVTSWEPDDRVFAFSPQFTEGQVSLIPVDGWPLRLSVPRDDATMISLARNSLALADVDNNGVLELITVTRDFGSGLDESGFNDPADDRYYVYVYETEGRFSEDLEWPVWRGNFGLTGEYDTPEAPPEPPPPPPPPPCEDRAPGSPILSAPLDGAGDISGSVNLRWQALADWGVNCEQDDNKFLLYLDRDSNPTTIVDGTLPADELHANAKGLKYSSTYFWKVQADNGVLSSESPAWRFNTCVPESKFPGDLTCDCAVTVDDLIAIAKIYGSQRGEDDFDPALDIYPPPFFGIGGGDGRVNIQDLVVVADKWGTRCSE